MGSGTLICRFQKIKFIFHPSSEISRLSYILVPKNEVLFYILVPKIQNFQNIKIILYPGSEKSYLSFILVLKNQIYTPDFEKIRVISGFRIIRAPGIENQVRLALGLKHQGNLRAGSEKISLSNILVPKNQIYLWVD